MPRQAPNPAGAFFGAVPTHRRSARHRAALIQIRRRRSSNHLDNDRGSLTMTEAQFELMLGSFREQHNELRAIHEAALGKLRGISYALYIILGINLVILA